MRWVVVSLAFLVGTIGCGEQSESAGGSLDGGTPDAPAADAGADGNVATDGSADAGQDVYEPVEHPGAPALDDPGEPSGTWPFEPGEDTFGDDALLDLRDLNEDTAGESGFIGLSADGNDFVRGDGTPERFWAVNSFVWRNGMDELRSHARFLAKRGVNMVRWHGQIQPKDAGAGFHDIDEEARDQLWQLVAAMKEQGIYVTVSPYYPHATEVQSAWPVPRDSDGMTGLLFFDSVVQDAYKAWLRALLEPENPYTGVALKDEPAVGIIQVQNEDSLLFWTVDSIKGADLRILQEAFGAWLVDKYGSLADASTAWDGASVDGDDFGNGRAAFYIVWHMTQDQTAGSPMDKRLADQLAFWTETMRSFNQNIVEFLRNDIGAKQLVNAGNWKTADIVRLGDAERYSYTSAEVIGVNRYYGGGTHEGQYKGWAIVDGDKFHNKSVLEDPRSMPVHLKQVAGHPMIIPESNWVPPLGYQSEGPFLVSVFQSLTGVDAFYWFATGNTQWRPPSSANGYLDSLGKWVFATPELLGNFPAASLLFRRGLVDRGAPVVQEKRSLQDLWQRRSPILAEGQGFDPNRDSEIISPDSNLPNGVDPMAFLVGPVNVTFDEDTSQSSAIELAPYVDEANSIVRSVTDQITWDHGKGICTINAPAAQGASGFLSRTGTFELADVAFRVGNEYATLMVVSMDGLPLPLSHRILVQAGTSTRPTGWEEKATTLDGEDAVEIVNFGEAPWQVADNAMSVAVWNPNVSKATALTPNGEAQQDVALDRKADDWVVLEMPSDSKYVVLE